MAFPVQEISFQYCSADSNAGNDFRVLAIPVLETIFQYCSDNSSVGNAFPAQQMELQYWKVSSRAATAERNI
jgi:hypothetical protein